MSSLTVRIVSALVALPVVVGLIQYSVYTFLILLAFVVGVSVYEFMDMTQGNDRAARWVLTAVGVAFMGAVMTGWISTPVIACFLIAVLIFFLFRVGNIETVAARAAHAITGILWAGGLLAATGALRLLPDGEAWLYLACVLAWGSDTGAYFAGKYLPIEKHKLYEKVSPQKTWEGSIGGVIVATAGAFGLTYLYGAPKIDPLHLAVVAPLAAALGQVGDLAESLLKRSVGVKDSGKIMPGHGGLLDRVDALLFAGPALLAYAVLVLREPLQYVRF
jgi:phosphatidate cytidylyltransferase